MGIKSQSRLSSNVKECTDWAEVTKEFDPLPIPAIWWDEETGEDYQGYREAWIYRGHKCHCYRLKPSIEREFESSGWAEMEKKILREFQSKAPLLMEPSRLPESDDQLSWLATMQHHGAPTRLLDFTFSPYVALYFALRNRERGSGTHAEVWAIDAAALRRLAMTIFREADRESARSPKQSFKSKPGKLPIHTGSAADYVSSPQEAQREDDYWEEALPSALYPHGIRKQTFNSKGMVAVALPPTHNLRLSSQQGVFLFNGALGYSFEESLELMMREATSPWYKRFRIPEDALPEIEKQLFQMNIHELSLFPDTEGLAGFVRQRIRLHLRSSEQ